MLTRKESSPNLKYSVRSSSSSAEESDESRWSRPVEVISDEKVATTQKLVLQDENISRREIMPETKISSDTVHRILHHHLRVSKVRAR